MGSNVNDVVTKIKRRFDYNISDSSLDALVIDAINDNLRVIKQWFMDYNLDYFISSSATIKPITNVQYKQLDTASIIGDTATYTGVAGDKLNVTIDGTLYTVAIATPTTIALVASAINTAVGSTVATVSADTFLQITSTTTGATSSVTVADGTAGNTGEVARLFSNSDSRTDTGVVDIDQVLSLREKTNDGIVQLLNPKDFFALYPDETEDTASTADHWTWWDGKLYFGPTPSQVTPYYMEFYKSLTDVAAGGTMPFDAKYDPLVVVMAIRELTSWLDSGNATAISQANNRVTELKNDLIVGATKNIGMNRQTASRRDGGLYFNPRMVK